MADRHDWKAIYDSLEQERDYRKYLKYLIPVLLAVVVIVLALMLLKPTVEEQKLPTLAKAEYVYQDGTKLYIKNTGTEPVVRGALTLSVDGKKVSTTNSEPIKPGETAAIEVRELALLSGKSSVRILFAGTTVDYKVHPAAVAKPCGAVPHDECAPEKPLYCSSGTLVGNCGVCGCSGENEICKENACVSVPCVSGLCCDTATNAFKPNGTVCQEDAVTEYGCPWGTLPDNDVGIRKFDKHCSGYSAACDTGVWEPWHVYDNCTAFSYCVPNVTACQLAAKARCSDSTIINQCSDTRPWFCTVNATLVSDCQRCFCPSGQSCQGDGTCSGASAACDAASYPHAEDALQLSTQQSKAALCGQRQYFKTVLSQRCSLTWGVKDDDSSDYSLYTSWNGSAPNITQFDCRPQNYLNEENCTQTVGAGTYYAFVQKETGNGTYNVSVATANCTNTCSDGTPYGTCSEAKPLFCSSGSLVPRSSECNCAAGLQRSAEACSPLGGTADLDVLSIERTPKYPRYRVTTFANRSACAPENANYYPYADDRGPQLCPGEAGRKRSPAAGDTVTFYARIANKGTATTGDVAFRWFLDTAQIKNGTVRLEAGAVAVEAVNWTWVDGAHRIRISVDPLNALAETNESNNALEDNTSALSLGIFIAPNAYANLTQPTSPEDWVQRQVQRLNLLLQNAGVQERVRIDRLFVASRSVTIGEPVADWRSSIADNDTDKWNVDAWWGIEADYRASFPNYRAAEDVDYSLLRDLVRQLGIAEVSRLYLDEAQQQVADRAFPGGKAHCGPNYFIEGFEGNRSLAANECHRLADDISADLANNASTRIGTHTAAALSRNLGKRRGYVGEYMFDIPDTNRVRFLNASGQPLLNATVKVYQKGNDSIMGSAALQENVTDSSGEILLMNVNGSWSVTNATETGHRLKPSPFGFLNVSAGNGLLMFEINTSSQVRYKFLSVTEFNLEYWRGSTGSATYVIRTNIAG